MIYATDYGLNFIIYIARNALKTWAGTRLGWVSGGDKARVGEMNGGRGQGRCP